MEFPAPATVCRKMQPAARNAEPADFRMKKYHNYVEEYTRASNHVLWPGDARANKPEQDQKIDL